MCFCVKARLTYKSHQQLSIRGYHGQIFLCVFSFPFFCQSWPVLSFQYLLTILIQLQFDNLNFARMDAHANGGPIRFVALNSLYVDDPLLSVRLDYFTDCLTLVMTTCDLNFIVFSNGQRADVVFLPKVFTQRGTHELSSDTGRRREMGLAAFTPGRTDIFVVFHFFTTFPRWRTEPKRTIPQGAARSKCDVCSTSPPNLFKKRFKTNWCEMKWKLG